MLSANLKRIQLNRSQRKKNKNYLDNRAIDYCTMLVLFNRQQILPSISLKIDKLVNLAFVLSFPIFGYLGL